MSNSSLQRSFDCMISRSLSMVHGLRTSCVSILVHEGFDVKSIQKWVGHKDIETTLKIYAKVKDKEAKQEILKGMNSLIPPRHYEN